MWQVVIACLVWDESSTEPRAALERAVAERRAILRGEFDYEAAWERPRTSPDAPVVWQPPHIRGRVVFDAESGWHSYQEHWTPAEPTGVHQGKTAVRRAPEGGSWERVILTPLLAYQFHPDPMWDGQVLPIAERLSAEASHERLILIHPWKLGMLPKVIDDWADLNEAAYLSPPPDVKLTMRPERIGDEELLRLEYPRNDRTTVEILLDPARALAVRKVTERGSHDHGAYVVSIETDYDEKPTSERWFPRECRYVGVMETPKYLAHGYRLAIRRATFPPSIDSSRFTVAALEPPPNTMIARGYPSDLPTESWNGREVVPVYDPNGPLLEVPRAAPVRKTWLLWTANAAILTALALGLLNKRRRHGAVGRTNDDSY
jgi:hypothetical protein